MSEVLEEVEELIIIEDRASKIDALINELMIGKKKLSFSSLKAFRQSPDSFIEYVFKERKQTDAMFLGVIIHCLVLEPEKFEERYTIMDDTEICGDIGGAKPRSTSRYKEWKEAFLSNATGEVVPMNTYIQATIIAGNITHNRASKKVLSICPKREQFIEWNYKNFGFRGYYDGGGDKARMDVKLVPDASPRKAQRTIIDMWYHGQAAMYLTAEGTLLPFYIICADRKGGVSVHKLHKSLIDHGLEEYSTVVDKFNECLLKENFNQSFDFWAEAYDGIYNCDKPAYMY